MLPSPWTSTTRSIPLNEPWDGRTYLSNYKETISYLCSMGFIGRKKAFTTKSDPNLVREAQLGELIDQT